MPFTIDGRWIPSKTAVTTNNKPVKVRLVKRGKSILSVILNLNLSDKELNALASTFKKKLGCGGAIKDNDIEIQGDKVSEIKKMLEDIGIKSS